MVYWPLSGKVTTKDKRAYIQGLVASDCKRALIRDRQRLIQRIAQRRLFVRLSDQYLHRLVCSRYRGIDSREFVITIFIRSVLCVSNHLSTIVGLDSTNWPLDVQVLDIVVGKKGHLRTAFTCKAHSC
jgi:hypothetical protein